MQELVQLRHCRSLTVDLEMAFEVIVILILRTELNKEHWMGQSVMSLGFCYAGNSV